MMKNPSTMTVHRADSTTARSPNGISNRPFWIEMLLESQSEGENTAMRTFFEPGVITHWHSHPKGQLLFVLKGVGRAQGEGGEIVELCAGDSVWFAPGERHWHGAAAESAFSYLSVQAVEDGMAVHWMEPVDHVEMSNARDAI
jgi:quercetin dioxygenase-like cupin family protein